MDRSLLKTLLLSVVLILATLLIYPYYKDSSRGPIANWHMINVNVDGQQGDANLIVIGDQVVMIDAGRKRIAYSAVVPYLEKFGIERIDHFFISHPNDAYYGGLISILDSGIPVSKVYHHENAVNTAGSAQQRHWYLETLKFADSKGAEIVEIEHGFSLNVPNGGRFKVIQAVDRDLDDDTIYSDDGTLIIRFAIANSSVLFSANTGTKLGKLLLEQPEIKAEFLKMPHPGESDPAPRSFFEFVDPNFVLVPGPKRRWCSDAGKVARNWSIDKQLPTWVTGSNGHIRVVWRPGQVLVAPQHVDERCKLKAFGNVQIKR
ncbi:MAG: ComEC/Rec2 family competence protein [bacterium]